MYFCTINNNNNSKVTKKQQQKQEKMSKNTLSARIRNMAIGSTLECDVIQIGTIKSYISNYKTFGVGEWTLTPKGNGIVIITRIK